MSKDPTRKTIKLIQKELEKYSTAPAVLIQKALEESNKFIQEAAETSQVGVKEAIESSQAAINAALSSAAMATRAEYMAMKTAFPLKDSLERFSKELQERAQNRHLRRCEQEFNETKNPLFAWDVFHRCQQWGIPLPIWVNDYMAGVALVLIETALNWKDVTQVQRAAEEPNPKVKDALSSSFGIRTSSSASMILSYKKVIENQHIYYIVVEIMEELKDGNIKGLRYELAKDLLLSELGKDLSASRIRKIYRKEDEKDRLFFDE